MASREDKRGGRFALVLHCLLNQNALEPGYAMYSAAVEPVVNYLIKQGGRRHRAVPVP